MNARTAALVAALSVAAFGTTATAAPKACGLAPDDKGDVVAAQASQESKTPDPALDLVMGDLGSDKSTLTAVIRVDKLSQTAPTSPFGTTYALHVAPLTSETVYALWANVTSAGVNYGVGAVQDVEGAAQLASNTGKAKGVFDTKTNEIRISAPLSEFEGAAPGKMVAISEVTAKRTAGNQFYGRVADTTAGAKSYKIASPTCVKVGK